MQLGKFGVWWTTATATPELAAETEKLGYGTIWVGGSPRAPLTELEELLDATERIVVASGIVNMWADEPGPIAEAYHRIEAHHPGRFLLGVGIGHPEAVGEYKDPYTTMVEYLEDLDTEGVPAERTVLAALGPKVLKLAADRTLGAHPYLTTPAHTASARPILGSALLAPEHKVVLNTDPEAARAIGRPTVQFYLRLINYRRNLLRHGFTEADLADGGSDALVDALVLHGDTKTVADGLRAHLDAGADHVCLQVLGDDVSGSQRNLAEELLS
ncbi:LLM class F420-dependent oxidoreductase [Sporichthya sp.]|uniref:LLM class F420-dependent oxidoreductase n=1 Tax=Sporichthya sp. TaxID=65475 RepID=UPI00183E8334|nr:LLM class F420-dependent oxidoreductase [Sporichthya sp.]MBA3743056.1 LLM class F420-dependent oxidoreductase [Sporichthya sp.]